MSVGRAGERTHPDILKVEKHVFETAIRMGVPPRVEIDSPDQARAYLDMGVRHFSIGTDIGILYGWWQRNGEDLRKALEGL